MDFGLVSLLEARLKPQFGLQIVPYWVSPPSLSIKRLDTDKLVNYHFHIHFHFHTHLKSFPPPYGPLYSALHSTPC